MPEANGTNENNEEIDADRVIRDYEESSPVSNEDQAGVDVEWHEVDRQDTFEPSATELTGGDIDGDWKEAHFSGEEVTDESDPTSEQEIVDEIGKSIGVTYEDAEPLRPEDKIAKRDEERWELNPVSSEDYEERQTSEAGEP